MEINITGRHVAVPDRFRRHIADKLEKVPQLDPRVTRCDVVVTHEANPRQAKESERIEITCYAKRSVIRAEAAADDEYGALDLAATKLGERLRRQHDKRVVHRGRKGNESLRVAAAVLDDMAAPPEPEADELPEHIRKVGGDEGCPIELREKVHASEPMTVDQALREMELVGHDFYLYHDADTDKPSVIYRRRGWSYGVIHLDITASGATVDDARTAV